jgi:GT2 family glycosyltransferase
VVVDNESTDGTRELVEDRFPQARVVPSFNRGFGHANNRGAMTCDARYVLFLNPDTEILEGTFEDLVTAMDERPEVGLMGVRQRLADGTVWPTIRYFPTVRRAFAEALACERWPGRNRGERELDLTIYDREYECDWVSGSFMLVRREALLSAGMMDERFFIYAEEPDLCLRLRRHGWRVRYLPEMTIVHHWNKGGVRPRMIAQGVYARRQFADKHFSGARRLAYLSALGTNHAIRVATAARRPPEHREAAVLALQTLVGRAEPPFGTPPRTAIMLDTLSGPEPRATAAAAR